MLSSLRRGEAPGETRALRGAAEWEFHHKYPIVLVFYSN